jgi:hypothetical protein
MRRLHALRRRQGNWMQGQGEKISGIGVESETGSDRPGAACPGMRLIADAQSALTHIFLIAMP